MEWLLDLYYTFQTFKAVREKVKCTQRRFQVIAQTTKTNKAIVTSNDATVQEAVKISPKNRPIMLYRWECEVCGMVHTGPLPAACDSCGKEGSLVHQPDLHQEMTTAL